MVPLCPWVRANRNLHAKAAAAQPNTVDRFRIEVIRNEFVVSLKIVVADIEVDGSLAAFRALAQDFNRLVVPLEEWRNHGGHKGLGDHLGQRLAYEIRYEPGQKAVAIGRFNRNGHVHGWGGS